MLCPVNNFTELFEFGEDRLCGGGPHEGLGMLVVLIDELADLALQIGDGVERPAADRLVGDQREPALDLVEPGAVGRGEVQVEARPPRQPGTHFGVLVGGVIVADQVHIEVLRNAVFDVTQEGQELLVPVAGLALGQDAAISDIQGRKERGGAVADVVVGDAFHVAQTQRQHGLGAFQGLHLAFFIHAQDQCVIRRVQVQADDSTMRRIICARRDSAAGRLWERAIDSNCTRS